MALRRKLTRTLSPQQRCEILSPSQEGIDMTPALQGMAAAGKAHLLALTVDVVVSGNAEYMSALGTPEAALTASKNPAASR